jgi:hypothetical protein
MRIKVNIRPQALLLILAGRNVSQHGLGRVRVPGQRHPAFKDFKLE